MVTSDAGPQPPGQVWLDLPGWRAGGDLLPLEEEMRAKTAAGEMLDGGEGPFDLAAMQAWREARAVRAAVLRHLLVDDEWSADARGVQLRGVRINGRLDLEAASVRRPLVLKDCYLDAGEPVCLDHATVPRLTLTRCRLAGLTGRMLSAREVDLGGSTLTGSLEVPGADVSGQLNCRDAQLLGTDTDGYALVADGMKTGSDVLLDGMFIAAGAIRLYGAQITGQLNCAGAQLAGTDTDGYALAADRMKVGGNVYLDGGFTAAGAARLADAAIVGLLACRGAQLTGRDRSGYVLVADRMKVGGNVYLDGGFTAAGAVRLAGVDITGQLNCAGARLAGHDSEGYALVADEMKVGGHAFLNRGFTAAGAVQLANATISHQMLCTGVRLEGHDSDGYALAADGIKVGQDIFLNGGVTAAGAFTLLGAEIAGSLICGGTRLAGHDSDGYALVADRMKVGGDVFFDQRFTVAGAVRLAGSDITGQLNCRGAQLADHDNGGNSLVAFGMKAGGDVLLDGGFTAAGTVSLRSACINGSAELEPAALAAHGDVALNASEAQITGRLWWKPAGPVLGQVNLEGATVSQLVDGWGSGRPNGFWPTGGQLRLNGFTYGSFGGGNQATVDQRLAWIRSQYQGDKPAAFATQPYEQLAAVYRRAGQETEARKVAIARRADLRTFADLNPYRKAGNWLLDKTIKYGYQSWRAGVGLVAAFVIFWILSILAQQHHLMMPVGDTQDLHFVPSATKCISGYTCFYPAGYAVDTVIPIINVHQADNWGPDGSVPWGRAFVVATWVATGLGWALATLLVAGYTGLVRQE